MSRFAGPAGLLPSRKSSREAAAPARRGRRKGESIRSLLNPHSVVGKLFILQLVVVLLLSGGALAILVLTLQRQSTHDAEHRSLAVAEGFANAPGVAAAMKSRNPPAILQPVASAAAARAGVDYIGVVNRDGIRYTASTPALIGKRSSIDMAPLLAGRTTQAHDTGALGPRVRAEVPIRDTDGRILGAVGAGVRIASISHQVGEQLPALLGITGGAVVLATAGTALLSRRLLRQTRGMGPAEITRMYEHHDAVLHAAREGVLIVDGEHRLLLANDEARRLLDLPLDAEGRQVTELDLPPAIAELLVSCRVASDEVRPAGGRVLAVNQRPTEQYGGLPGSVTTLRDSTELQQTAGRAQAAQDRLKVLYHAGTGIGTTLDVARTARELGEVAVPAFADFVTVDVAEGILRGDDPADTANTLRRVATVGVRQDPPLWPDGTRIRLHPDGPQAAGLATGHAVREAELREGTAWAAQDAERARRIIDYGIHSLISAPLHARGVVLGVACFWRSQKPEPFEQDDVALAEELATRAAVSIDNARRYTREHAMAVTLQRSLLPASLPEQNALDVAYRYLPAHQSVGGDWFDVIPLSGTRVALVVGDVVGHGLHAAATMGRLRTAVHNFAALELTPDEILGRLDELADRIDRSEDAYGYPDEVIGATCVYAIYDPVERRCGIARAGHLPPLLRRPDGTLEFLDAPAGPPLGIGGSPFVTTDVEVPGGSTLLLYTDGLVEDRGRDIDESLDLLRTALSGATGDPERVCGSVLAAMLPHHPEDDVALLVARTRVLPPEHIARWDVPAEPTAVGMIRTEVAGRLAEWDLAELGFTTELILSELVTNAIRHADAPIGVRLLLDRKLICEVSDGSSTSPHLRYATATEEGGRGLFLVDQVAERWGTRYTAGGKVIWAEQPLPAAPA
ncbi:SpoIIE family protein phosphatase/ATP-binding protein [Actinacidiphila acididurans]|uniref:SpoIIE family protein phosphatase n=1 Tax=Actinacidiphila acididurans TaxID=2784346 RepID=A0ABS2TLQ5_9ACTN|nr:SpoIIE family protein phosphatase/ATP-binding protein [Actinacidiphila acididurans]MBM9504270.1 SpoIIE family protein phosphatase [Actinacidiphila acididurans]